MVSEVTGCDNAQMGAALARLLDDGFSVIISADDDSCSGDACKSHELDDGTGKKTIIVDKRVAIGRNVLDTLNDLCRNYPTRKCCGPCQRIMPLKFFSGDRTAPMGKSYRCRACDLARKRTGKAKAFQKGKHKGFVAKTKEGEPSK